MDKLLPKILLVIREGPAEYRSWGLRFPGYNLNAYSDGNAHWTSVGSLPLNWTQRRSVARAVARRRGAMERQLIDLGLAAQAKGWKP